MSRAAWWLSALPILLTAASWDRVVENRACFNAACSSGLGFSVAPDGSYKSGRGASGTLSADELLQVESAVAAIGDLGGPLACQASGASGAEAGVVVNVARPSAGYSLLYHAGFDGSLCAVGPDAAAVTLKSVLDGLAARHDPYPPPPPPPPAPPPGPCTGQADGVACGDVCGVIGCPTSCFETKICQLGQCQQVRIELDCASNPDYVPPPIGFMPRSIR